MKVASQQTPGNEQTWTQEAVIGLAGFTGELNNIQADVVMETESGLDDDEKRGLC